MIGPVAVPTSAATIYQCPDNTAIQARRVHVSNPTGSDINFTLSVGALGTNNRIYNAQKIKAGQVFDDWGAFSMSSAEVMQVVGSQSGLVVTIDPLVVPFTGPLNFWAYGNSLTSFAASTLQAMISSLAPAGSTFNEVVVGGANTPQLTANFATNIGSHFVTGARNVCVMWEIIDDVNDFGATATTAYQHYQQFVTPALAAQWTVGVGTCIATLEFPILQPERDGCNVFVRGDNAGAQLLCDYAAQPELQDASNTTYFEADGIHIKQPGRDIVAWVSARALGYQVAHP